MAGRHWQPASESEGKPINWADCAPSWSFLPVSDDDLHLLSLLRLVDTHTQMRSVLLYYYCTTEQLSSRRGKTSLLNIPHSVRFSGDCTVAVLSKKIAPYSLPVFSLSIVSGRFSRLIWRHSRFASNFHGTIANYRCERTVLAIQLPNFNLTDKFY